MPLDFELSPEDRRPLYLQIADLLRGAIVRGALKPGDPLPSVRELARILDVHTTTILQAFSELTRSGFVAARRGRGTFVLPRPYSAGEHRALATEVAGRALTDAQRHGLSAAELIAAIERLS
jgi:GntR family transcriptional regulator